MQEFFLIITFFLTFGPVSGFSNALKYDKEIFIFASSCKDTVYGKQILYNGIVWRDLNTKIKGDPFLYSNMFLPGSVQINDKSFQNVGLKYDIYNDELLIITDQSGIIQLNKEMIDSFIINFETIDHRFLNIEPDSSNIMAGYVEVFKEKNTTLYIKHIKEIVSTTEGKTIKSFLQSQRYYVLKENRIYKINRNKDLIVLLGDKKQEIRSFIKTNKIHVTGKIQENILPVLKFYDSICHLK